MRRRSTEPGVGKDHRIAGEIEILPPGVGVAMRTGVGDGPATASESASRPEWRVGTGSVMGDGLAVGVGTGVPPAIAQTVPSRIEHAQEGVGRTLPRCFVGGLERSRGDREVAGIGKARRSPCRRRNRSPIRCRRPPFRAAQQGREYELGGSGALRRDRVRRRKR